MVDKSVQRKKSEFNCAFYHSGEITQKADSWGVSSGTLVQQTWVEAMAPHLK
jgi:hypothetical protein